MKLMQHIRTLLSPLQFRRSDGDDRMDHPASSRPPPLVSQPPRIFDLLQGLRVGTDLSNGSRSAVADNLTATSSRLIFQRFFQLLSRPAPLQPILKSGNNGTAGKSIWWPRPFAIIAISPRSCPLTHPCVVDRGRHHPGTSSDRHPRSRRFEQRKGRRCQAELHFGAGHRPLEQAGVERSYRSNLRRRDDFPDRAGRRPCERTEGKLRSDANLRRHADAAPGNIQRRCAGSRRSRSRALGSQGPRLRQREL